MSDQVVIFSIFCIVLVWSQGKDEERNEVWSMNNVVEVVQHEASDCAHIVVPRNRDAA